MQRSVPPPSAAPSPPAPMDWQALYFEAIYALLAMECRAERAEAALAKAPQSKTFLGWKLNPELVARVRAEAYLRGEDYRFGA